MLEKAYIAIDLHKQNSVVGYMNQHGQYLGQKSIPTEKSGLISAVVVINANRKILTIEQSNLSHWAASLLACHVDELIVCDPRHNKWISSTSTKNDAIDTYKLCELTRLEAIKPLYYEPDQGHRRLFWAQMQEYQRCNKMLVYNKQQLSSSLSHWGYSSKVTRSLYKNTDTLLKQIQQPGLRDEIKAKLHLIGFIDKQKEAIFERARQLGKQFWEIREFQRMPGIGPAGAHLFSALIQNPHRFRKPGQLIKFCQLAVRHHSSDGRPTRSQRLSKAGHGIFKAVSYRAWQTAMLGDNEVSAFYHRSLERCGDSIKARLNTQRKILISLWTLWKNEQPYRSERFFSDYGVSTR